MPGGLRHAGVDLYRQLAGGYEDQCTDAFTAQRLCGFAEFFQQRQHKGRGFARASIPTRYNPVMTLNAHACRAFCLHSE